MTVIARIGIMCPKISENFEKWTVLGGAPRIHTIISDGELWNKTEFVQLYLPNEPLKTVKAWGLAMIKCYKSFSFNPFYTPLKH